MKNIYCDCAFCREDKKMKAVFEFLGGAIVVLFLILIMWCVK